jgi:hypothetical protein
MAETKDNTTTTQMDISIEELLGTPGGDNIMVPAGSDKKPNLFSRTPKVDVEKMLLDKTDEEKKADEEAARIAAEAAAAGGAPAKKTPEEEKEIQDLLKPKTDEEKEEEEKGDDGKKAGRPTSLVELGTKLIEKGYLTPFEGEEDVSKYTLKDWEELFESNEKEKSKKLKEEVSGEFYEGLPEELQVAAHYVANGGTDLKGMFRSLAAVEEVRQLDPKDANSQEAIIRGFLHATNFGTAEEIEEEIEGYKDHDELEAKAIKFKPKLDAMQEQQVARQLQQQDLKRKQQEKQAQVYTDNIYKVLEPGDLNGIKLDKKQQNMLFAGLTQANYPSVSGRPTNLLGHLLEKYQYVEPNHALITEALWLLADPEGYKAKLKAVGGKEQVDKTVRTLKTEQSNKSTSSQGQDDDDNASRKKPGSGIQRPSTGFFKR